LWTFGAYAGLLPALRPSGCSICKDQPAAYPALEKSSFPSLFLSFPPSLCSPNRLSKFHIIEIEAKNQTNKALKKKTLSKFHIIEIEAKKPNKQSPLKKNPLQFSHNRN
jgi:hypothetical protein